MSATTTWRKANLSRDHRWAQSRLSAYLDGELPARRRRRLAAHEDLCPECRRVLRTLRRLVETLGAIGAAKAPPQLAESAVEAIARDPEDPRVA